MMGELTARAASRTALTVEEEVTLTAGMAYYERERKEARVSVGKGTGAEGERGGKRWREREKERTHSVLLSVLEKSSGLISGKDTSLYRERERREEESVWYREKRKKTRREGRQLSADTFPSRRR